MVFLDAGQGTNRAFALARDVQSSPKPSLDRRCPSRSFAPFVGIGRPSSPRRDEAFGYRYDGKQNLRTLAFDLLSGTVPINIHPGSCVSSETAERVHENDEEAQSIAPSTVGCKAGSQGFVGSQDRSPRAEDLGRGRPRIAYTMCGLFHSGRGTPPGELEHSGFRSSCRLLPRGMKKSLRSHTAYDVMLASGQTRVVSSCILFVSSDGQSDLRRLGHLSSTLETTQNWCE